jgi:Antitoxin of toxin-antitoxin, RelE / RelB, TA system
MPTLVPTHDFSPAKGNLSELMSKVVNAHQPQMIHRFAGREAMLLLQPSDMERALASFRFEPQVTISKGEVTAALPDLNLLGFGSTTEEAVAELVDELRHLTKRFFEKPAFYLETDRAAQYPWLLRFAITPDDRQLELMYEEPPTR